MGDTLNVTIEPPPVTHSVQHWALAEALALVHMDDERSVARRERAFELLRTEPERTAQELRRLDEHTLPDDVTSRWEIAWTAGHLAGHEVLRWLHDEAVRELPAWDLEGGCESVADGAAIVCVMAVESMTTLGGVDDGERLDALVSVLKEQAHVAVRAAAATAVFAMDDSLRERVARMVPEDQQWIIEIARVDHTDLVADAFDVAPKRLVGTPPSLDTENHPPRSRCCC